MLSVRQTPILRPFSEAVAAQRKRVPMTREQFDRLSNEAKMRAWTIAGLAKRATLEESWLLAQEAIEKGLTKGQFHDRLNEILEENGGNLLGRNRTGLIFQNNHNVAIAAGRYDQLRQIEGREYWQYPLIPNDARLSDICRPLLGYVAHRDHPSWKSISPPNHHKDRHKSVRSLTREQAEATGKLYQGGDGEAERYPFVDDRRILPDPGFDFEPGLLNQDGKALLEAAQAVGAELPAKDAAFYGLGALGEIAEPDLRPAPPVRVDVGEDAAWSRFQEAVGIRAGAEGTVLQDRFGDGVVVNRQTFDHLLEGERRFDWIGPTLEDPTEVWMVPSERRGGVVFVTRYLAVYTVLGGPRMIVMLERSPEGWLTSTGNRLESRKWETIRRGFLVYSKARRANA